MKTKNIAVLILAFVISISFAGCVIISGPAEESPAPTSTETTPTPTPDSSADPSAEPTPDPIAEEFGDPELWSDTEVFGYLKTIEEDNIVVTVKGEDISYTIADKARINKAISVLDIAVGDYVLVVFTIEDGIHYTSSLGKAIPPKEDAGDTSDTESN